MNREIRIIKPGARDKLQEERVETAVTPCRHEPSRALTLQITRTIKDWVKTNKKRNIERLFVAQSLKRCPKLAKLRVDIVR